MKKKFWLIPLGIIIVLIIVVLILISKKNIENNITFNLNGPNHMYVVQHERFTDPMYSAYDDSIDISRYVTVNNKVDITTLGTY